MKWIYLFLSLSSLCFAIFALVNGQNNVLLAEISSASGWIVAFALHRKPQ
jgi:hypothetical protein